MTEKKLPLDEDVLKNHIQKYANSCVPMAIELVLKLMDKMDLTDYTLQDDKGDVPRGGKEYDGKTICDVEISIDFDEARGPNFPLPQLFKKIQEEIDNDRFVNCACKDASMQNFHAYVIYGYKDDELLAISTDFKKTNFDYIDDMKTKLKNIYGSDILTFKDLNPNKRR